MRSFLLHVSAVIAITLPYACTYDAPTQGGSPSSTSTSSSSGQGGMGTGSTGGQGSTGNQSSSSSTGVGGIGGGIGVGGGGGSPNVFPSVHCGEQGECTTPLACCTDQVETYSCLTPPDCELKGNLAISCDGPEDCPGQICCGRYNQTNGAYDGVYCATKCILPFVHICHFDEPDPLCPEFLTCHEEPLLGPRYGYCGP